MKGYITKDFSAYKVTTGTDTQNLALVFGEGVDDEKYVDFSVTWLQQATIEIIKKDRGSNALLAGAVYGVYGDEACQNLIVESLRQMKTVFLLLPLIKHRMWFI